MEIAVWTYRAVTGTCKDVKPAEKLLKNPEGQSKSREELLWEEREGAYRAKIL